MTTSTWMEDPYVLLGLDPGFDAETDEGRRALKRAKNVYRRAHPDKHRSDPNADARFVALQQAYEVVSDPQLRIAYDVGGHQMVRAVKAAGPDQAALLSAALRIVPLLKSGKISSVVGALLCVVTCCIVPLLFGGLLVIALKAERVGKLTQISWALALTPLWIVDALFLSVAALSVVIGSWCQVRLCRRSLGKAKDDPPGDGSGGREGGRGETAAESCGLGVLCWAEWCIMPAIELALFIALEVLLVLRADGVLRARTTPWVVVLSPWLALEALLIAHAAFRSDVHYSCGAARVTCRGSGASGTAPTVQRVVGACVGAALTALRHAYAPALRLTTAALATLKLQGTLPAAARWAIVVAPIWLWAALELAFACVGPAAEGSAAKRCCRRACGSGGAAEAAAAAEEEDGLLDLDDARRAKVEADAAEEDLRCVQCCAISCHNVARLACFTGPVALLALLLVLRIDRLLPRLSFAWVALPVLLPLLCAACLSTCALFLLPLCLKKLPKIARAAKEAVEKASKQEGGGDGGGARNGNAPASSGGPGRAGAAAQRSTRGGADGAVDSAV